MSSKPGAGINHKEFGVTSEGVAVFVERALREVGLDARKDAFRVCLVGGPDGDVAGNLLKIMQRDWPSARVVGVADGSGYAEDPEGLDGNELRRLVEASAPIASFDSKLLGNRGTLRPADDGDGAALRDTMHFRVDADVLVPCGGRPGTIHAGNARDFLKPGDDAAPGAPRAPICVEIRAGSRRWRGGRGDDSARTRRKFDFHTGPDHRRGRQPIFDARGAPDPTCRGRRARRQGLVGEQVRCRVLFL